MPGLVSTMERSGGRRTTERAGKRRNQVPPESDHTGPRIPQLIQAPFVGFLHQE